MRYSDFEYVDVALGGAGKRNNVITIKEFKLPQKPIDCYVTYFRFNESYKKHFDSTGSVSHFNDIHYSDFLRLDLDHEDTAESHQMAKSVVSFLELQFGFDVNKLRIFFSGAKGFHIELPAPYLGEVFNPHMRLYEIHKAIAEDIFSFVDLDVKVYDINRLWRLPNSINSKSSLYKIFLTPHELINETIESIKTLAKAPRKIMYEADIDTVNDEFAQEARNIARKALSGNGANSRSGAKPLILEKITKGNRNNELFKKGIFFHNRGFTQEEAVFYLSEYNNKYCDPPIPQHDIETLIESAFRYEKKDNDERISLPYSEEAEKSVLASILNNPPIIDLVAEKIGTRKPFYEDRHVEIWDSMLTLYERKVPIDDVSLITELKRRQVFDIVGGEFYLTELRKQEQSENVEYHIEIVVDKYTLRQTMNTCQQTILNCQQESEDAGSIITKHESNITTILSDFTRKSVRSLKDVMHDSLTAIERAQESIKDIFGFPTGFSDVDNILGGLQNTDMIVLAGRTSQGKTATALNMAVSVSKIVPVGYFSLEMSDIQLGNRIIAMESGVDLVSLRRGTVPKDLYGKVISSVQNSATFPIFIDDSPSLTPFDIRARSRHMFNTFGVRFIVIDYLQFLKPVEYRMTREQQVAQSVRSIKALAKELNIPIIVISQLSRKTEDRGGTIESKRPQLQDLRESGSIENDADVVMTVFRPEWYGFEEWGDGTSCEQQIEVGILKHRNGPIGKTRLLFIKESGQMKTMIRTVHGGIIIEEEADDKPVGF
jgi:replicative DNA helicase